MDHQTEAVATKAVAGIATANVGIATYLDVIQGALGILATSLGIILTSILIYREIKTIKNKAKGQKRRSTDER